MEKLSVVIITYNEERNIERCILSVRDVADEIIVVDSYSTDQTVRIGEELGAKVIPHPFGGHIQQKNYALSLAGYQWVLSLDADEALSPEACRHVEKIKEEPLFDGYYFNRLNQYCGKWVHYCGWYPDRKLRLFNRSKGKWGGSNPHDKVIMDKNAKVKYIDADILHYSFYSIDQHIDQINKFSRIKAEVAFNRKVHFRWHKLFLFSCFKFFRSYFLKRGFLDGYHGFLISWNSAYAESLKWMKLRMLEKERDQDIFINKF